MTPTVAAQHPLARLRARRLLIVGGIEVLLGIALLPLGGWACSPVLVGGGGVIMWRAIVVARQGRAVQLHNAAVERVQRGEIDAAEALLDQVSPAMRRWSHLARASGSLRALIAFYRGDTALAASLATTALAVPHARMEVGLRALEQVHRARILALRSLAHASLGDATAAERDAVAAETAPGAGPEVLARAALARAVNAARIQGAGERDARDRLAAHLAETGGLMLEFLTPRERTLVRALRRMARARPKSVYREAARPDDEATATEEGRLAAWIGALAPGAQAFVAEETGRAATTSDEHATATATATSAESATTSDEHAATAALSAEAVRDAQRARAAAQNVARTAVRKRTAFVWVLLAIVFWASWQVVSPASNGHGAADAGWWIPLAVAATLLASFVAVVARRVAGLRRGASQLLAAQTDLARGRIDAATASFEELTRASQDGSAAEAHLALARLAEQESRWDESIDHAGRGIARLSKTNVMRAASSDALLPELLSTRAFALVASGRQPEADAELALLRVEHPNYVYATRSHFRIALLSAVRSGDLAKASEVARGRTPELPLSLRDDLLADVVLAATSVVPKDERERIDGELGDDPKIRAWIDGVAPGLRQASRVRVSAADERAAEEEPEHEPEALEADERAAEEEPKKMVRR